MSEPAIQCPLTRAEVIAPVFILNRTRVVEIAAYLDRVDRARPGGDRDFLIDALLQALNILVDGKGNRTVRILQSFSDPTIEPLVSAQGMKGADGAYRIKKGETQP